MNVGNILTEINKNLVRIYEKIEAIESRVDIIEKDMNSIRQDMDTIPDSLMTDSDYDWFNNRFNALYDGHSQIDERHEAIYHELKKVKDSVEESNDKANETIASVELASSTGTLENLRTRTEVLDALSEFDDHMYSIRRELLGISEQGERTFMVMSQLNDDDNKWAKDVSEKMERFTEKMIEHENREDARHHDIAEVIKLETAIAEESRANTNWKLGIIKKEYETKLDETRESIIDCIRTNHKSRAKLLPSNTGARFHLGYMNSSIV